MQNKNEYLDRLLNVKKIIVRKYCHDGTSSAMIIKDVLHNVEVFFADHKDREYLDIKAEPGLLFCDISPPENRWKEFFEQEAIVLDHHEKTKNIVLEFENAGLGKYGEIDQGYSGASLAYEHVWIPLKHLAKTEQRSVCKLSRLAAIRDTYSNDSLEWDDACVQTEAIAFFPSEHFIHDHKAEIYPNEEFIGKLIVERNASYIKSATDNYYSFLFEGKSFAIIPGHKIISDASEVFRKIGISVTLSFAYKVTSYGNVELRISARSDGSFDCNKFASNYGGGGHIKAAGGITIPVTENSKNPYSSIIEIINQHGKDCFLS